MTTSILGFIIRLLPLQNIIPNSYFNGLLQSHSHTGFLGWVFLIIYILLLNRFGKPNLFSQRKSQVILIVLSVFIFGMTLSFPFTGYGFLSISFLTLFLLFSYYSLYYLYKHIDDLYKNSISYKFLIAAILFYLLSSISPWLLGPIIAKGYKKTPLYYNDIFFYLHFLYNGFITFSIISLYFIEIELKKTKKLNLKSNLKNAFIYLSIGTVLNYSSSLLWNKPSIIVFVIAFISTILLLVGIYFLTKEYTILFNEKNKLFRFLFLTTISMFLFKNILMLFQSFPKFAELSYHLKSQFIIGYIHLVTLGFISSFIISYLIHHKMLSKSITLNIGILSFIIGYYSTEIILFTQGIFLWNNLSILSSSYSLLILIASTFLLIGFIFIFIASTKKIDLPA